MKNRIAIETKILTDADAVAQEAAKVIAAEARGPRWPHVAAS